MSLWLPEAKSRPLDTDRGRSYEMRTCKGKDMKKLPIGIQTFENLIEEGYAYVDKTRFVADIVTQNKYYFLSRPRRFGKSLLLSTLKAAFEGKRELFQGLYLHDNWDWEQTNPVVHISFGSGVMRSVNELKSTFSYIL